MGRRKDVCCPDTFKKYGRTNRLLVSEPSRDNPTPTTSPITSYGQTDSFRAVTYLPPTFFGPFEEFDEEDDYAGSAPGIDISLAYTPDYTVVSSLGTGCYTSMTASYARHDPDGILWLPPGWPTWDGVTTLNPCTSTAAQIVEWVWPASPGSGWQMRGLREMFYDDPPFADNTSPTVQEIEAWHIRVIRLYRDLLGVSTPIASSRDLYLRSHFNDERKYSTFWDSAYPGTLGSANGPCVGMSPYNAHCGATFVPNCPAQEPYLRTGDPCVVNTGGGAEGIFGGEFDWPWAIKLSRVMRNIVEAEGISGHGGPFLGRPYVGMSFKCDAPTQTFTVRIKWNGPLVDPCP